MSLKKIGNLQLYLQKLITLQAGVEADTKYVHFRKSKISRMDKIQKDPAKPSPGDYNIVDSFTKTQSTNIQYKIGA